MKAYFGFMIVMGINRLPETKEYWFSDDKLHNNFIASHITWDRFEEISHYLHFTDNTTLPARDEPGYHQLQKVLPIVEHLRQRFLEAYRPNVQNSIDEAMIPFKGKNHCMYVYSMYNLYIYVVHTYSASCCVIFYVI